MRRVSFFKTELDGDLASRLAFEVKKLLFSLESELQYCNSYEHVSNVFLKNKRRSIACLLSCAQNLTECESYFSKLRGESTSHLPILSVEISSPMLVLRPSLLP